MKKLVVNTPSGEIVVQEKTDTDYPGVVITVGGLELVMVEHNATHDKPAIYVWDKSDEEGDPVYSQVI